MVVIRKSKRRIFVDLAKRFLNELEERFLKDETGFESIERASSLRAGTIHIHLDKSQPDPIQICRCLLDTGSDCNLVSERIVRSLQLTVNEHEVDPVTPLGGIQILPIGTVELNWHMDNRKSVIYSESFLVVPETAQPSFDVILSNNWIEKYQAFQRNPRVMLARHLRFHR